MEQLSLRDYHREIEKLIENSGFDTAIAHCRHILKEHPKNIDTYRLLGKAYLESQHYTEAIDIFQRVLSVYPDDFLAHLGLSIIKEEQGNLEAAIWHLERAYEVQPSNPALQSELKRLHGRRDGIEPPKIRLTRAALARMYQRGELYPQALAEVQSALAEDPSRIDLEILQAQLFAQMGKPSESFQLASKIASKLPYSYQANKIISQSESYTDNTEAVSKARDILSAIDPYEDKSISQVESADEISENLVMVEKLTLAESDPSAGQDQSEFTTEPPDVPEAEITLSEQNDLPAESAPADVTDEAQLPAIKDLSEESAVPAQPEVPDTEEVVTDEQRKKVISKMMVDLTDLDGELDPSLEDTVKITIKPQVEEPVEEIITPEVEIEKVEPEEQPDPDLPSWLSGLEPKPDQSSEFKEKNTVPEWLFAMDDSLTESDKILSSTSAEDEQPELADTSDIDQAIAWLEGLAEKHGVPESSLLLPTENRIQQAPEWISRLKNVLNDEQQLQMESAEETELDEVMEAAVMLNNEIATDIALGEVSSESEEIIEEAGELDSSDQGENLVNEDPVPAEISDTAKFSEAIETDTSSQSLVTDIITPGEPDWSSFDTAQVDSEIPNKSDGLLPDEISGEPLNKVVSSGSAEEPQIESIDITDELVDELAKSTEETQTSESIISVEDTIGGNSTDSQADTEPININQVVNTEHVIAADEAVDVLADQQADHPGIPESISDGSADVDAETTQAEISDLSTTLKDEDLTVSEEDKFSDSKALELDQEIDTVEINSVDPDMVEMQDTEAVNDELSSLEKLSEENPEDIESLRQLAKAYTRSGKFDEAKTIYRQIEKILRQ